MIVHTEIGNPLWHLGIAYTAIYRHVIPCPLCRRVQKHPVYPSLAWSECETECETDEQTQTDRHTYSGHIRPTRTCVPYVLLAMVWRHLLHHQFFIRMKNTSLIIYNWKRQNIKKWSKLVHEIFGKSSFIKGTLEVWNMLHHHFCYAPY